MNTSKRLGSTALIVLLQEEISHRVKILLFNVSFESSRIKLKFCVNFKYYLNEKNHCPSAGYLYYYFDSTPPECPLPS